MTTLTDAQLTEHIRQAMFLDERLSEQPVEVSVTGGVVRLEGTVQNHRRELAAVEIASSFVGCLDVDNALRVDPAPNLSDEEVSDHVRQALAEHPNVSKSTISVAVTGGRLILRGSVRTQWDRIEAEDVALSAPGVRAVENLLLVDVPGQFEDRKMRQRIKASLARELGDDARALRVAVAADTAVLSGHAPTRWHCEKAEEIVRLSRILHIRNEIEITDNPTPATGK